MAPAAISSLAAKIAVGRSATLSRRAVASAPECRKKSPCCTSSGIEGDAAIVQCGPIAALAFLALACVAEPATEGNSAVAEVDQMMGCIARAIEIFAIDDGQPGRVLAIIDQYDGAAALLQHGQVFVAHPRHHADQPIPQGNTDTRQRWLNGRSAQCRPHPLRRPRPNLSQPAALRRIGELYAVEDGRHGQWLRSRIVRDQT